jgi:hypothetical protein
VTTGLEGSGGARLFLNGVQAGQIQSGETSIWVNKGVEVSVESVIQVQPGERLVQDNLVRRVLTEPAAIRLPYQREVLIEVQLADSEGSPLPEQEGALTLVNDNGVQIQVRSGSSTWMQEGVWKTRSITWGGQDVLPSSIIPVRVEAPGRIMMRTGVYSLQLAALDALGLPLGGVLVDVVLPNGRVASTVTDSSGGALVTFVTRGNYTAVGRFLGQVASVSGRVDEGAGIATLVFLFSPNVALLAGFLILASILSLGFFTRRRT